MGGGTRRRYRKRLTIFTNKTISLRARAVGNVVMNNRVETRDIHRADFKRDSRHPTRYCPAPSGLRLEGPVYTSS